MLSLNPPRSSRFTARAIAISANASSTRSSSDVRPGRTEARRSVSRAGGRSRRGSMTRRPLPLRRRNARRRVNNSGRKRFYTYQFHTVSIPIPYRKIAVNHVPPTLFQSPEPDLPHQAATDTAGSSSARTKSLTSCRAAMFDMLIACGSVSRRSSSVSPDRKSSLKTTRSENPGARPEADPPRQRLQRRRHPPLVPRIQRRHPVAEHHPVHRPPPPRHRACRAFHTISGIEAKTSAYFRRRIQPRQHVEIDQAIVHRRDQRVRRRMRQPRVSAVGSWTIHHDVVAIREFGQRRLGTARPPAPRPRYGCHSRSAQAQSAAASAAPAPAVRHVVLPVVEVAEQALLPQVEIQRPDHMAGAHQRGDQVHGGGRLPRATLLVAHHDQPRHASDLRSNQMPRSQRSAPPNIKTTQPIPGSEIRQVRKSIRSALAHSR